MFNLALYSVKLAIVLTALTTLFGCATGANSGAMVVNSYERPQLVNAELKEKISVRYVGGGKETNPMLAS